MILALRDAIFTAVSYADIFDYPLTMDELSMWMPFVKRRRLTMQGDALRKLIRCLVVDGVMYYSLRAAKRLVAIRSKRVEWSRGKWARAQRIAKLLICIPTIRLVGVTGALTRSNATDEDDIDFIIITAPKTLWVSRALATILLDLFGLRRRPSDTHFRNLICLNMFMSVDGLSVPIKERDLFTAHEVLLMKPIWERDNAYTTFLRANTWVKKFLPNAWEEKSQTSNPNIQQGKRFSKNSLSMLVIVNWSLRFIEPLSRNVQLWYMRRRLSIEIVTDKVIRFHPRDARVWIKKALGQRLSHFNIPLDKIFYGR